MILSEPKVEVDISCDPQTDEDEKVVIRFIREASLNEINKI